MVYDSERLRLLLVLIHGGRSFHFTEPLILDSGVLVNYAELKYNEAGDVVSCFRFYNGGFFSEVLCYPAEEEYILDRILNDKVEIDYDLCRK